MSSKSFILLLDDGKNLYIRNHFSVMRFYYSITDISPNFIMKSKKAFSIEKPMKNIFNTELGIAKFFLY